MADLRKRGDMSWGAVLMQFVTSNLPNLLAEFEEGQEEQALEKLAKVYREQRTATIRDRAPEIADNRAAVDARLEERKAEKRDKPERSK